jgi:hypothetical protein
MRNPADLFYSFCPKVITNQINLAGNPIHRKTPFSDMMRRQRQ